MSADTPVLDTLTDMTKASVEHNSLSPRDFVLARVAALIAVDAPPVSWFANAAAIEESGLTAEDVLNTQPPDRFRSSLRSASARGYGETGGCR